LGEPPKTPGSKKKMRGGQTQSKGAQTEKIVLALLMIPQAKLTPIQPMFTKRGGGCGNGKGGCEKGVEKRYIGI